MVNEKHKKEYEEDSRFKLSLFCRLLKDEKMGDEESNCVIIGLLCGVERRVISW